MDDIQQWEISLIGTLLGDQKRYIEVMDIQPTDMSSEQHKLIWSASMALAQRGGLGPQSLINELTTAGVINDIGIPDAKGPQYIFYMMAMGDPNTINEFGDRVRNAATNRRLVEIASYVLSKARNGGEANKTIDWFAKEAIAIRRDNDTPVLLGSLNASYEEQQRKIVSGEEMPFWVPPLAPLAKLIDKMNSTDFCLIVGKPGTGKSSLMRYLALETALRGDPVLVLPFENSREEYHSWSLAQIARVNHARVEDRRRLKLEEYSFIEEAEQKIASIPYHIKKLGIATIDEVVSTIRRFALSLPRPDGKGTALKLIEVDGMYLISGKEEMYDRISNNTQTFRNLAQEIGVPIVATTQYSRKIHNKKDPEMSDLMFAGENAARLVMAIVKEEMSISEQLQFPMNKDKNGKLIFNRFGGVNSVLCRIDVMKNTGGQVGVTEPFVWHKPWNIYEEYKRDAKMASIPDELKDAIQDDEFEVTPANTAARPASKQAALIDNAKGQKKRNRQTEMGV